MKHSKMTIARIQLERAIELFFEKEDYISAITLSGASEEITRKILERENVDCAGDKLQQWFKERYPDAPENSSFFKHANHTRNRLKHFDNADEAEVYVDQSEAAYWLCRAIMNYDWAKGIFTKTIIDYINWSISEIKSGNLLPNA